MKSEYSLRWNGNIITTCVCQKASLKFYASDEYKQSDSIIIINSYG